jgi:hypothetical protein
MKIFLIFFSIVLLSNCSNINKRNLSTAEYLCSFSDTSNNTVDFSLKFLNDHVHIISWWIDRGYKDLVVDYHDGEVDVFRSYTLGQKIDIYKRLDDSQNKILLSIDVDTLTGIYDDQDIIRSKVICIDDQKASYKMSLKIAIGKKNYAAFAKQKGF